MREELNVDGGVTYTFIQEIKAHDKDHKLVNVCVQKSIR